MTAKAYYNEIDPFAAQWLRNLISAGKIMDGDVDERSIVEVQPSDLEGYTRVHFFAGIGGWDLALQLAGWPEDRPVWTGSCPCQPFSAAGRRRGVDDERHLWPILWDLILRCEPRLTFGEQVGAASGRVWASHAYSDVEGSGYGFAAVDLDHAGFGLPHARHRIFWVAYADSHGEPRRTIHAEAQAARGAPGLAAHNWHSPGVLDAERDGVRGRVGRMRGYGNAIVPQVAAEFIGAVLEAMPWENK